jgi:hypothetical protein
LISKNKPLSLIFSIIYTISGAIFSKIYAGHLLMIIALPLFPACLYFLEKFFLTNNFKNLLILLIISIPFIYSGHPQGILMTLISVSIYSFFKIMFILQNKKIPLKNKKKLLFNIINFIILFTAMLTYKIDFSLNSLLKLNFHITDTNHYIHYNPFDFINLFYPFHSGNPEKLLYYNNYTHNFWEHNSYIGIIVFILAIYSFLYVKNKYNKINIILIITLVILSLGDNSYLFDIIKNIPILKSARNLCRWNIYFSLFLVSSALLGMEKILNRNFDFKKLVSIALVGFSIIIGYLLIILNFLNLNSKINLLFFKTKLIDFIFIFTITIIFIFITKIKHKKSVMVFSIFLILLDSIFFNFKLLVPFKSNFFKNYEKQIILPDNKGRVAFSRNNYNIYSYAPFISESVPTVSGFTETLINDDYYDFLKELSDNKNYISQSPQKIESNLIDILTIKYIYSQKKLNKKKFKLISNDNYLISDKNCSFSLVKMFLYKNKNAYKKYFVTNNISYIENKKNLLENLKKANVNILIKNKKFSNYSNDTAPLKYNILHYEQNNLQKQFKIFTNKKSFLYISENFDDNWKVLINKKQIDLIDANYLFSIIPLKKGINNINLNYKFPYKTTLLISLVAILISILLLFFWKNQNFVCIPSNNSEKFDKNINNLIKFYFFFMILILIFPKYNYIKNFFSKFREFPYTKSKIKDIKKNYKKFKIERKNFEETLNLIK